MSPHPIGEGLHESIDRLQREVRKMNEAIIKALSIIRKSQGGTVAEVRAVLEEAIK